jgi:hypothetical protein
LKRFHSQIEHLKEIFAVSELQEDSVVRKFRITASDDDRVRWSVGSRNELEDQLAQLAASAFYANAPREDGEFAFHCDEYGVVDSVLRGYEDRIDEVFRESDDGQN